MIWSELLVITTALSSLVGIFFFTGHEEIQSKLHASLALTVLAFGFISFPVADSVASMLDEWTSILGVTFLLIMFATVIRSLKPVYARYPHAFSYTPLIIPIAYPFIADAEILKSLMNQVLQGGVVGIALLLYIPVLRKSSAHLWYITGVVLSAATYTLFWFDPWSLPEWIWHMTLVGAIISGSIGLNGIWKSMAGFVYGEGHE